MEKAGIYLTLVWLSLIGFVLWFRWEDAAQLPLNGWGDFLAGAFSPLAFLWLIVGYNLQRKELKSNTGALMHQKEEMARQAEELAEQNEHLAATASLARAQEKQLMNDIIRESNLRDSKTGRSPLQERKIKLQAKKQQDFAGSHK